VALYTFSDGAISVYTDMVALYVGAGIVGTAALVALIAGSSARRGAPRLSGFQRWGPLALTLVVVAIVPSLCRYGVPFEVRLRRSEAALIAAARETPRGARAAGPRWIGLLRVEAIDTVGGATRFFTGSCGLAERCGVAHSPDGQPPLADEALYKQVRGPFWAFELRPSTRD
jgi:hypothetical protein